MKLIENYLSKLANHTFIITSFIFFVFFSLTFILRYLSTGGLSYIGEKVYYYLRLASGFSPLVKDELIIPNTKFFFDPTIIFYIPFQYFPNYVSIIIQLVLGIASIWFIYSILSSFIKKREVVFICVLLVVLSPFFLYSFVRLTPFVFISFFLSLAVQLYIKNKEKSSLILFILISLLGIHYLIGVVSILFCLNNFRNRKNAYTKNTYTRNTYGKITYCKFLIVIGALYYLITYLLNLSPPGMYAPRFMQLTSLFTGLGDATGYGTFFILLAFLGIFMLWKERKDYWYMYLFAFLFGIYGLFFTEVRIFSHIFLLFFSAQGLLHIIYRKWNLKLIKKMSLFVIFLGLLFSSLSFIDRESVHRPVPYIKEIAMELPKGIVLTDLDIGHVIQYYSKNPVLYTTTNPYDIEKSKILFSSRNIEITIRILEEFNVDLILITKNMKDEIFSEEQGLLFLLENSKRFKKIHSSSNVDLWVVMK